MKKMMIPVLAILLSAAAGGQIFPTAVEPKSSEQPEGILDKYFAVSDSTVVAIGATGKGPMGRGYLKNDGKSFTFVKDFEDKPEFKYTVVRLPGEGYFGIRSMVSNKLLRSSKNEGYRLIFDTDNLSSPESQFVLWASDPGQLTLEPVWLYNRATNGYVSVRTRPDEIVTSDHTGTGAQHDIWEELFMEVKEQKPTVTQDDLALARKELGAVRDEIGKLRLESGQLAQELKKTTEKLKSEALISAERQAKIKELEGKKSELAREIARSTAERDALKEKLLNAVDRLQRLIEAAKVATTAVTKPSQPSKPLPTESTTKTQATAKPAVATQSGPQRTTTKSTTKKKSTKKSGKRKKSAKKKKARKSKKNKKKKRNKKKREARKLSKVIRDKNAARE